MDKNGQDFDSTGESNRLRVGGGGERKRERGDDKSSSAVYLSRLLTAIWSVNNSSGSVASLAGNGKYRFLLPPAPSPWLAKETARNGSFAATVYDDIRLAPCYRQLAAARSFANNLCPCEGTTWQDPPFCHGSSRSRAASPSYRYLSREQNLYSGHRLNLMDNGKFLTRVTLPPSEYIKI